MKKVTIADICIYLFCSVLAFIMILPFYNVVIRSIATPAAIASQSFYIIPTSFDLTNFDAIVKGGRFLRAFGVSIFVSIVGTLMSMVLTIIGAYVLSKKELPGRRVFMMLIIFTMFFNGGLIPYYLNIKGLGLANSIFVMMVPHAINTFYLIIMMNSLRSIPKSLEESAKIDGANYFTILMKIIMPISKPTIAAVTLFYAVDRWNEWWTALLFISDSKKYPMQLFLRELLVDITSMANNATAASMASTLRKVSPDGIKMAAVVVTIIPIMMVYPYLQKHFAAGVMLGSIKE